MTRTAQPIVHSGRRCRSHVALALTLAAGLALSSMSPTSAEQALTVEKLLSDGWEIAGYTGAVDNRSSMILFKHKDKKYLAQCSVLYDVTRTPRTATNCYLVK